MVIDKGIKEDSYSMAPSNTDIWPEIWSNNDVIQNKSMQRAASEVTMSRRSLNDVMEEFRMNGVDTPYEPHDDTTFIPRNDMLGGLGPSSTYLRQKSWPEPERTPIQRLKQWNPAKDTYNYPQKENNNQCPRNCEVSGWLTEEQSRVLSTLPDSVVHYLLRCLEQGRNDLTVKDNARWEAGGVMGCRFCRNNGERESFVRSHNLKDSYGRVSCPVLRAFVCTRCGAHGDNAHTIKYCPLSSTEERYKSTAIMRSMRMASGRRRFQLPTPSVESADNYVLFGEPTPSFVQDPNLYKYMPLDPLWAALEQKLSM